MKQIITNKNVNQLIKGASLLTTGGGLSYAEQKKSLSRFKNLSINILSLDKLPKNSYICTAAEIGPSNAPPLDKNKIIKKMFDLLEKVSKKKINAIYPPEIGQESIIIETASLLGLPILDFDPVGLRAVPFLDINIFNLNNLQFPFDPIVVCTYQGEIFLLKETGSYERVENILRQMTKLSKSGIVFFLGGIAKVGDLKKNNSYSSSYLKAFNLGSLKNIKQIENMLKPKIGIAGIVLENKENKIDGFFAQNVLVKDTSGKTYKLIILNEVIFLLDNNNNIISSVPDRILLIDPKILTGISSADLKKGRKILILVLYPEKQWSSKKAEKLFGKKRFEFLLENI